MSAETAPSIQELTPGVWADARRAVWIEAERTLLVADVHLGFAWVGRRRGVLLPLASGREVDRLRALFDAYRPGRGVFLGDTVHATAELGAVEEELRELLAQLDHRCPLEFVLGNHDTRLPDLFRRIGRKAACCRMAQAGPHVLVHGDDVAWTDVETFLGPDGVVLYGHEHPAMVVGDGVTTSVRVPCFLIGRRCIVLPAFSDWAAGQVYGREPMLSPLARGAAFHRAITILGDRLLPVEL